MVMLDFIVSHLAESITLLLAIIAVVGLLLNYLFRPTKIEVEKRHSDDLKKLIERWKSEIATLSLPQSLSPEKFAVKIDGKYSLNLLVEKEYYFDDIKNHLPSDLDLLNAWKKFKENWYDYEKKRHDFFKAVKDYVSKKIELPWAQYSSDWDKNPCFSTFLIQHIYDDLLDILEEGKPYWVNYEGKLRQENDKYRFSCDNYLFWTDKKDKAEKAKESYFEILKNLPQSPYIEQAKDLQRDNKHLCKEKEMMERKLSYFAFIPLLPGKCKYITWSLPGITERIKKKLFR